MNALETIMTQGFGSQSPESEAKFRVELLEGAVRHAKGKARDEIMENVARTLAACGIQFKLVKEYKLDMTNSPVPNGHELLVDKAAEIVKKYGGEEVVFEH